ncbi:hypothetical protein ACFLZQ_03980 [Thermodesulfobacteriota bacterium]
MKKDDLIILIISLLLLAGMLITLFFGGERSRHGVGTLLDVQPEQEISFVIIRLDLCQSGA